MGAVNINKNSPFVQWERIFALVAMLVALFAAAYLLSPGPWRAPAAAGGLAASVVETAVAAPRSGTSSGLAFPLPGYERFLRDNFAELRGTRKHQGLDIMAPRGTPVLAVDDGTIAKLYRGPMAGIAVYQFDAALGWVYFYAHLDRHARGLKEGQAVKRGDVIGYVGSTGNAPEHAPHLHFEVHELGADKRWWKGRAVNPYPLLRAAGARP